MAKLYPFKYRFENPGILPLTDDLWFESHQELLLRIVNTPQGRELLCIDKSFDGIKIVGFGKNRVTGFLGFEGKDRVKLVSDFRVGAKWANVIRYRWREFQALAREHYSDKVNKQTEILLGGEYRMAATTSTFYPDPHPETTTVDGYTSSQIYGLGSGVTWAAIINDTTGAAPADSSAALQCTYVINDGSTSDRWRRLLRHTLGFDTAIIGADKIDSAICSVKSYSKQNQLNLTWDTNIYSSAPASNTGLVDSDFANFGSTAFSASISYASWDAASAYNDFTLNASGLAYIDASGVTNIGIRNANHDVAGSAPAWLSGTKTTENLIWNAENAGTSSDPKLVVVHIAALLNTVWF